MIKRKFYQFKNYLIDIMADKYYETGKDPGYLWAIMQVPGVVLKNLRLFVSCSLEGHMLDDVGSYAGPESAKDSFSCRCGKEHFEHTYY